MHGSRGWRSITRLVCDFAYTGVHSDEQTKPAADSTGVALNGERCSYEFSLPFDDEAYAIQPAFYLFQRWHPI
jgi:hypothetical protein